MEDHRATTVVTDADAGPVPVAGADSPAGWLAFVVVFLALLAFDLAVLAPRISSGDERGGKPQRRARPHLQCVFWFCVGLLFNAGIWASRGRDDAIVWFNGYMLEYLLSLDNVFFFHVVLNAYATPVEQRYKALFLGILGSLALRFAFFCACAAFLHLAVVVQVLFGFVLIWSGYQTATAEAGDDDPRNHQCVRLITRCLPVVQTYDPSGRLFVRTVEAVAPSTGGSPPAAPTPGDAERGECAEAPVAAPALARGRWRGTMLLLVVVVLQVVDALFAVDSVTAKLAEHNSVFLNFSSTALAMLCLRSLYFVLVGMLTTLRFMKYGVASIQGLLGVKLILSQWVEVEELVSLVVICSVFLFSILLSLLCPESAREAPSAPDAELPEQRTAAGRAPECSARQ